MNFNITSVTQLFLLIGAIAGIIRELVTMAQEVFGKGKGPEKFQAVISGVQALVENPEVPEIWERAQGIVTHIIEFYVKFKTKDTTP